MLKKAIATLLLVASMSGVSAVAKADMMHGHMHHERMRMKHHRMMMHHHHRTMHHHMMHHHM